MKTNLMKMIISTLFFSFFIVGCQKVEKNSEEKIDNQREIVFTYTEFDNSYDDRSESNIDVISVEEAVVIISDYLNNIYDNRPDGLHMSIVYHHNPHFDERIWIAYIYPSENEFNNYDEEEWMYNIIYDVNVDAQTGEVQKFSSHFIEPIKGIGWEKMEEMPQEKLLEVFPEPDEEEIAQMKESVVKYAILHHPKSPIKEVYYGFKGSDGEPEVDYAPSQTSPFYVLFEDGTYVDIWMQRETHTLIRMSTMKDYPLEVKTDAGA